MDTTITSENQFQIKLIQLLEGSKAHVQRHNFSQYPDVPDLSVGFNGQELWLELKYGVFELPHPPRTYDRFHFDTLTRGQLKWMVDRETNSGVWCGILAYWRTGHNTAYVSYIPCWRYVACLWQDHGFSAGAAVLSRWTARADDIKSARDVVDLAIVARAEAFRQP